MLKPKTRKLSGDQPVGQRRLFEVADAVDVEGDPVAGVEHVAGGVGVGGVGVVEQGGVKRAAQKMTSQRPQSRSRAVERRAPRTGVTGGCCEGAGSRNGCVVIACSCRYRITGDFGQEG